jgi:LIVCS family branched-chain amino acid:cation transporter
MSQAHKHNPLSTGFAMFSMFFGAGNVVFPLALGQYAQAQTSFAMLGLLFTGVLMPFAGLMAMTLFEGDYRAFFQRIGPKLGFIVAALIMALIGPFGAMPRTVTLSYSTAQAFIPGLSLPLFSLCACLIIFFFTYKKRRILDLLGFVLTPVLLLSLGIIVVKGCLSGHPLGPSELSNTQAFVYGLKEGYLTMDLMGAFFFSAVVISCLRAEASGHSISRRQLTWETLKASFIGAGLLGAVYTGFAFVAAMHFEQIGSVPLDILIAQLALHILGPYAGIVVCIAVSLACLTTAIALAAVFADFLRRDILAERISYPLSLGICLVTMYGMSTVGFEGILQFLAPVLGLLYPSIIVLSLMNIAQKLWGIETVKAPVAATFVASLIIQWGPSLAAVLG